MTSRVDYRQAKISDIPALLMIENLCFTSDKLNERSFKYFINKNAQALIVQRSGSQIIGYGLLLFRKGSKKCRLYSIAIDPRFRGRQLGRGLLYALERLAQKKRATCLYLEVKMSNKKALKLYDSSGYVRVGIKRGFYEDKSDALCLKKEF